MFLRLLSWNKMISMFNDLVSWDHSLPNAEPPKFRSSTAGLEADPPSRCGLLSKGKAWWSCWMSCPRTQVWCFSAHISLGLFFQSIVMKLTTLLEAKCNSGYQQLSICRGSYLMPSHWTQFLWHFPLFPDVCLFYYFLMLQIKKLKFQNISLKRKLEVCVKLSWIIRKRLPTMKKQMHTSSSWKEILGK